MIDLAREQIQLAFQTAQHELDFLHQRTREGVRKAQADGKQVGRAEGTRIETQKAKECKPLILKHSKSFGGSLAKSQGARSISSMIDSSFPFNQME